MKHREGEEGIGEMGHRAYVGGMWEEVGKLQFDFLVGQGLKPSHFFLDIGCGALRGGVHFIRYLEPGHYLGIEKERTLLELGIERELGRAVYEEKKPELLVSARFEVDRLSRKPEFSVAQSLFTHLEESDIRLCLGNLGRVVEPGHLLFATFFEGSSWFNPKASHSHEGFRYTRRAMQRFGEAAAFRATYIGPWRHPRGQMMMRFERAG